jgi:hypothetical protein
MRVGIMSLIIDLSIHDHNSEWLPRLKNEFRSWDGKHYFIPNTPRGKFNKILAQLALKTGGPELLGRLLKLRAVFPRNGKIELSSHEWNLVEEDAQIIGSCS